jgi:hypothetical protein
LGTLVYHIVFGLVLTMKSQPKIFQNNSRITNRTEKFEDNPVIRQQAVSLDRLSGDVTNSMANLRLKALQSSSRTKNNINPENVSISCTFFFPLLVNLPVDVIYACVASRFHKVSICPRHFQLLLPSFLLIFLEKLLFYQISCIFSYSVMVVK